MNRCTNPRASRRLLAKQWRKEVNQVKKIAIRNVETLKTTAAMYPIICWQ
jgi:hypothetical protein